LQFAGLSASAVTALKLIETVDEVGRGLADWKATRYCTSSPSSMYLSGKPNVK
jgi:hypothetical protein